MTGASGQKLILIVDDIEDNRVLLERALRSSGYATLTAECGREALRTLFSSSIISMSTTWRPAVSTMTKS